MPIGNNSKLVSVVLKQPIYDVIKKYCELSGQTISNYCKNAISKTVYSDIVQWELDPKTVIKEVQND